MLREVMEYQDLFHHEFFESPPAVKDACKEHINAELAAAGTYT